MKDRIIVGTPVKLSHILIGIIVVIFLSLFLTGFGYQPWWLFLIVLNFRRICNFTDLFQFILAN